MQPASASEPSARPIPPALVAGCLCINIAVALWALITRPALNSDFRGPWAFANFARHQPVAQIYQAAPMQAYQHALYPGFQSFFPFQYPPSFLLAVRWLSDFSYPVAQTLWLFAGLAALVAASWWFFAPRMRWYAIAALLAAPSSLLNGVAGETGFFTTALLFAGFALLPSRPLLAGFALGLLTLKPQLAVLIPIALLARGERRAMIAACLTALALIALSCATFPTVLWADWLRQVPVTESQYLAAGKSLNLNAAVTIAANLIRIGMVAGIAWVVQELAGLAAAGAVFFAFRRASYRLAVAALFAGSFVCAPHAYAYDTLPLTAAVLLLPPAAGGFNALCLLIYLAPDLLLTGADRWFLYAFPETLLFTGMIYLALRGARYPNIRHEPISATKSVSGQH